MQRMLRLPAVSLLALGLLFGCSDDDDSSPEADPSPTEASETEAEAPAPDRTRPCRVTVDITGAATASWEGKGTARLSDSEPKAFYLARQDGWSVTVAAPLGGNPASANATLDGTTYATPLGNGEGVDAQEDGSGASVNAEAIDLDEATVNISAEFVCGRGGSGGAKED